MDAQLIYVGGRAAWLVSQPARRHGIETWIAEVFGDFELAIALAIEDGLARDLAVHAARLAQSEAMSEHAARNQALHLAKRALEVAG
jgi:hypothetical protein